MYMIYDGWWLITCGDLRVVMIYDGRLLMMGLFADGWFMMDGYLWLATYGWACFVIGCDLGIDVICDWWWLVMVRLMGAQSLWLVMIYDWAPYAWGLSGMYGDFGVGGLLMGMIYDGWWFMMGWRIYGSDVLRIIAYDWAAYGCMRFMMNADLWGATHGCRWFMIDCYIWGAAYWCWLFRMDDEFGWGGALVGII